MNGVTGATSWLPRPVPPSFSAGDVPDVANALRVPGINGPAVLSTHTISCSLIGVQPGNA